MEEAIDAALARPRDVVAQIAAAYACDRAGEETRAVRFYDAAWALGVPAAERVDFAVGYGSTLRNVGRADEAVRVLEELVRAAPEHRAGRCFLALALHSAGRSDAAIAELLDVALAATDGAGSVGGYAPALAEYRDALRG